MISDQKLAEYKKLADRTASFGPHGAGEALHTLVAECRSMSVELRGGDAMIRREAELRWRELEVSRGLAYLHGLLSTGDGDKTPATLTVELLQQMLSAKGARFNRDWSSYQARLFEEFPNLPTEADPS